MATDDELVTAWHTSHSNELLAVQLGMDLKTLRFHWRRLRAMGLVPMVPRPLGQQRHGEALSGDGRPTVGNTDPLLDRLVRHHSRSEEP